jgi:integrase
LWSFHPRLSAKSIRLMHACLRVHLNQAKVWGMVEKNPAIGVKLPRKKQRKPTILLPLATIGKLIDLLPEPTKTVVVLIVFGSLRIGEVLALRWRHLQADRINIEERVYEGEFDDVKTDAWRTRSAVRQARVDEERPDWEMERQQTSAAG